MINNLKNILKEKTLKYSIMKYLEKSEKKIEQMKKYRLGNGRKSNIIIKQ